MCISTPKVGAQSAAVPTDTTADGLQLGTAALSNRSGGILGRIALTGGTRAQRQVNNASSPTPSGSTSSDSPGGTMGLPSDYLGQAVFGGLKPKVII